MSSDSCSACYVSEDCFDDEFVVDMGEDGREAAAPQALVTMQLRLRTLRGITFMGKDEAGYAFPRMQDAKNGIGIRKSVVEL